MLLCDQKTFYVGITDNPQKRLNIHREEKSFFASRFSDINFVYCEHYLKNTKQRYEKNKSRAGLVQRSKCYQIIS